jgi:hypothetical protein
MMKMVERIIMIIIGVIEMREMMMKEAFRTESEL